MKIATVLRAALLSLVVVSVSLAATVAGKWKAEFKAQDGQSVQNTFTFLVDGEKLTGTVYSSLAGSEAKIEEGTIKGDDIAFAIMRNFGGTEVKMQYKGKVAGDEINFTVTAGQGGQSFELQMTAKREKS